MHAPAVACDCDLVVAWQVRDVRHPRVADAQRAVHGEFVSVPQLDGTVASGGYVPVAKHRSLDVRDGLAVRETIRARVWEILLDVLVARFAVSHDGRSLVLKQHVRAELVPVDRSVAVGIHLHE